VARGFSSQRGLFGAIQTTTVLLAREDVQAISIAGRPAPSPANEVFAGIPLGLKDATLIRGHIETVRAAPSVDGGLRLKARVFTRAGLSGEAAATVMIAGSMLEAQRIGVGSVVGWI
jgi:hypothetical protein